MQHDDEERAVRLGFPRGGRKRRRDGGAAMIPFSAFGHSHVVALAHGYDTMLADGTAPPGVFRYLYAPAYSPVLTGEKGRESLNPALAKLIAEGNHRGLVLSIGGNQHNVLSILQLHEKYDFVLGDDPSLPLDAEAEIYPEAMIRETLRDWLDPSFRELAAFRAASDLPMVQVAPPPPLPRAHVLAHPGELLPDRRRHKAVARDSIRHKVWRVQQNLYRERCAALGIGFVSAPESVRDADGMLAPAFLGTDATHANAAFGRILLGEALRRLGEMV